MSPEARNAILHDASALATTVWCGKGTTQPNIPHACEALLMCLLMDGTDVAVAMSLARVMSSPASTLAFSPLFRLQFGNHGAVGIHAKLGYPSREFFEAQTGLYHALHPKPPAVLRDGALKRGPISAFACGYAGNLSAALDVLPRLEGHAGACIWFLCGAAVGQWPDLVAHLLGSTLFRLVVLKRLGGAATVRAPKLLSQRLCRDAAEMVKHTPANEWHQHVAHFESNLRHLLA